MAFPSRRQRRPGIDIWPGFVDALSQLLIVIIFVLLIFTVAQFYLTNALSGSNEALARLNQQVENLKNLLALENTTSDDLRRNLKQISEQLKASIAERDKLQAQVAELTARTDELRATARNEGADKDALLNQKETELQAKDAALVQAQSQLALLNEQIAALRDQLQRLAAALDASEQKAKEQEVQIADLGRRLNVALANKVQELATYRSEFFGRLREILGNRPDIRIVGDRFVFQSEVLFPPGSADLSPEAKTELDLLAGALKDIAAKIPQEIPWVLRVDGHTDKRPISTPQFPSNWELSTARAIAVTKYLISQGIPPSRLAAAGFGEFQPIDPGEGEDAYRKNRRIEFKLTER
ncbi:MAG TPA: peptidoglycan -binding protein [Stellaceae bacterium]|nr:peptidoglycan -binding protein [Stellaceae bacterium]